MNGRYVMLLLLGLVLSPAAHANQALGCGSLENAYGPYDYTNPVHFAEKLPIVESGHFDSNVENLRGHHKHPLNLPGDLDYTLRAFPNHHRALYAMARYQLSQKDYKRKPMQYTADCYFERAMAFVPGDGTVRLIYGIFLYKAGRAAEAEGRFQEALELAPDSAEVHYNLGLVLADQKDYARAKEHAVIAYEMGYPMPGLRNKLVRAGAW